ncbi:hypothetical protein GGD56_003690 [Rhizobium mongolense]|uniref:Uncharacterized protein n=2 Tax=Rhizobium mongolense TaxID=57676 RepID=A0ABR6IPM6_9HYPH|nr:hypothetical protein [Rhizobium mongolense]TVZ73011.1 hypothetical protein BCL32_1209 [Rhizobium mongolense USDA 1844]
MVRNNAGSVEARASRVAANGEHARDAFFGSIDERVLLNDPTLSYMCLPRRLAAPGLHGWRGAIQSQMRPQPILSDWKFAHR